MYRFSVMKGGGGAVWLFVDGRGNFSWISFATTVVSSTSGIVCGFTDVLPSWKASHHTVVADGIRNDLFGPCLRFFSVM